MSRLWQVLVLATFVVLTAGCIESTTTVQVKRDGSGTVTETLYEIQSVRRMMDMLRGIGTALADEALKRAKTDPLMDRALYERRATAFGKGVDLVSFERVTRRDGSPGVTATYAFARVSDLSVPADPNYPPPVPTTEPPTNTYPGITFAYDPARPGELTVNIPWAADARSRSAMYSRDAPKRELTLEETTLVSHVLSGFRARLRVETVPPFSDTDASYVQQGVTDPAEKSVELFDVALGESVRNDRALARIAGVGAARDLSDALVKYVDTRGVKVEKKDAVSIRF